jgi:hypothetical protein
MLFLKEHLKGHYEWANPENNSSFNGEASRRLFDRFNGPQVLFMINLYGSLFKTFTIEEGQQVEDYIANRLPFKNESEVSVLTHLKESNLIAATDKTAGIGEFIHHSNSEPTDPPLR